MRRIWTWGILICLSLPKAQAAEDIFPLSEVKPGMTATWRTVVRGNELKDFQLEILGTVPEGLGPGWSTIVGLATDPEMIQIGGVAGMSGSPVYIDGKLLGAYSYTYTWSKDQAFVGITPIEQMFKIVDAFDLGEQQGFQALSPFSVPSVSQTTTPVQDTSFVDWSPQPVPTPLSFGGISAQTLQTLQPEFAQVGWQAPVTTGMGASSEGQPDYSLDAGQPMAAVLMTGDFNAAATGTITWRDGERLLGFGHSFLGAGNVAVPLAGAEVLTIVSNQRLSFKLSKFGDIVGTIFQDRASGIAGRIGPKPPMTELNLRTRNAHGWRETYEAQLIQHPQWTSLLAATTVLETANSAMSAGERQTLYLHGQIYPEGMNSISFERVATGPSAGAMLARRLFAELYDFLDNPFEPVTLDRIDLSLEIVDSWQLSGLRSVNIYPEAPQPGDQVQVELKLLNYRGDERKLLVNLQIPPTADEGDTFAVVIADGEQLDRETSDGGGVPHSLEDIALSWSLERVPGRLYAALIKPTEGIGLEGAALPNLPPSVLQQLSEPNPSRLNRPVSQIVVDEKNFSLPGIFQGSYSAQLTIR
ncbi:MAG: SpoIVB-like peptidase S55 family [Puniceicoccaceae bacterium 5H]|nr:MAG: SpoIVB-like peptidase S55 family [Puniceicoccaceae bacterium 5H]